MLVKKKIIIRGSKVHDVGYRLFLLDEAEALMIPYLSAKNIKNEVQEIEVLAGGEKEQVERFIELVKTNFPEDAQVDSVIVEDYEGIIRTIESFSRSLSISQLSKIARTGVAMLNIQMNMDKSIKGISKQQDKMLEKQDAMLGKQDVLIQKQDETTREIKDLSGRVDQSREEIVMEIRSLRNDLKSHFDERLNRLESEVSQIKAKICL